MPKDDIRVMSIMVIACGVLLAAGALFTAVSAPLQVGGLLGFCLGAANLIGSGVAIVVWVKPTQPGS